jgi:hypothetical protein
MGKPVYVFCGQIDKQFEDFASCFCNGFGHLTLGKMPLISPKNKAFNTLSNESKIGFIYGMLDPIAVEGICVITDESSVSHAIKKAFGAECLYWDMDRVFTDDLPREEVQDV